MAGTEYIVIKGAYENNLKHVSLQIPKKKITIFTGVSGSGKSSLVLDTIAATSRRELNETFPSFVQQYLPKYGRPTPIFIPSSVCCSRGSVHPMSAIPILFLSITLKADVPVVTDWEKSENSMYISWWTSTNR